LTAVQGPKIRGELERRADESCDAGVSRLLYQIAGPDWMSGARFDIAATIRKDVTKEQFRAMLRNLLAERFKLKAHHEKREMAVYSLVVGKNGPKMKESAEDPAPKPRTEAAAAPPSGPVKMEKDEEGFP
jgi:uncharacterized protein (TIGR03435 family)